jgi:hypothetical protein
VRALVLLAVLLAPCALAQRPELEAGAEILYYATRETALNRGNVLGLDPHEALLRANAGLKQALGSSVRLVFRGFVEQSLGGTGNETRFEARQAYAQYAPDPAFQVRAGRQRVAWGSGFAWNPTNRLEPAKNPLNTGLEQQGVRAARLDLIPAPWAGVVLVAAEGSTNVGDLPFPTLEVKRRTAAVRARFLWRDTDLAFVYLGGRRQKTLFGMDVARSLGRLSCHAEAALYRGSEIDPSRPDEGFFRVATGALFVSGSTSVSLEYFLNGEGLDDVENARYVAGLDAAYGASQDPALPPQAREAALERYLGLAARPYSGGMGLRRHYLQAAISRAQLRGDWGVSLRATLGASDGGVALTPGVSYAPREDTSLGLDAVLLLGPETSEYRLAPLTGALQARVKVAF